VATTCIILNRFTGSRPAMRPAELVWRAGAPIITFLLALGGSGVYFLDWSGETYHPCISFNLWEVTSRLGWYYAFSGDCVMRLAGVILQASYSELEGSPLAGVATKRERERVRLFCNRLFSTSPPSERVIWNLHMTLIAANIVFS
jgi:hypothetical protein